MSVAINTATSHPFIAQFLASRDAGALPGLKELREQAATRLARVDVPTAKHEEWRFVRLKPLMGLSFDPAPSPAVDSSAVDAYRLPEAAESTFVFVNGVYSPQLSRSTGLSQGVQVAPLSEIGELGDVVQAKVGLNKWWIDDLFYELNTASFADGLAIVVDRNAVVEETIHVLYLSTESASPFAAQPRNVIVAGESSQVRIVEEYVGLGENVYFTNVVNEVSVGANAHVDHFKVQRESTQAFHFARNLVNLASDSRYNSTAVTFGAHLSRNDSYALYEGKNIDCTLDGLAFVRGKQVADTHTAIDHAQPHSRSYQLHKCIVDDAAQTVFNGKIFVRRDAQQTKSEQLNQNLILSEKGKVNTKPQLEILADDVVCTHGATVGQIEDERYFYMLSRGLTDANARSLLTYAFAAEVIETITVESLKADLEAMILVQATG